MKFKNNTLLILLLLTTLFKGIIWSALVPMWGIPDEQAHFAQVQYYAEEKHGINTRNDLSQEIYEAERLLGTLRSQTGNNKFTYHPEYNIDYSNSTTGIHEAEIASLPKSSRTTYVKKEAARYPPSFYVISSLGYLAVYPFSLFVRLFVTRIISVFFAVLTVWFSYLLAKSIFPKNSILPIAAASFVSFQPMFTFLTSGVNNDNLINLIATALLWLMVDSIRKGLTTKHLIGMGFLLGLGIITKQLIYPFIPLPLLVIAYDSVIRKSGNTKLIKNLFPLITTTIIFGGVIFVGKWIETGKLPYWPEVTPESPGYSLTIVSYLQNKIPQLYRETLPWYWGVFKWLGLVLPLNVLRAIKIAIAISVIGLGKYTLEIVRRKRLKVVDWQLLILTFSSLWYVAALLSWEYMLIRSIGFSHGIQGRNFFPTIAAHMTLLVFGLWQLVPRLQSKIIKLSIFASVLLNFIALKTFLQSYYDISSISTLITQASQYKPWFFKGSALILWSMVYLTLLVFFLQRLVNIKRSKT